MSNHMVLSVGLPVKKREKLELMESDARPHPLDDVNRVFEKLENL